MSISRVVLYKPTGEKFKVLITPEIPNVNDVLHIGSKYYRVVDKVCEVICDETKKLDADKESILDISHFEYHCSVFELDSHPIMNKRTESEKKVLDAIQNSRDMHKRFLEYNKDNHPKFDYKDLVYLNKKSESITTKKCHIGSKIGQKYAYTWSSLIEQFECSCMDELPYIIYCVLSGFFYIDNIEVLEEEIGSAVEL